MLSLSCRQLGADDDFIATGDDKYEVMGVMTHHLITVHRDKAEKMNGNDWADSLRQMDAMTMAAA
ncbi:MAG: hypothetical protein PHW10_03405 [Candidatus Peribacteraceae bacterium]|nr:hypothetical protein [Candidatus Peribacteraceae bacterium]